MEKQNTFLKVPGRWRRGWGMAALRLELKRKEDPLGMGRITFFLLNSQILKWCFCVKKIYTVFRDSHKYGLYGLFELRCPLYHVQLSMKPDMGNSWNPNDQFGLSWKNEISKIFILVCWCDLFVGVHFQSVELQRVFFRCS